MKVVFIYPEVYDIAHFGKKRKEFPPFGVLYLATIVSAQNGVEVEIISIESGDEKLDLVKFDVVAFSIPSSVTYDIVKKVRFNSIYANNVFLIGGGVHANIFPSETLIDLKLHAVGIGSGEETIIELLKEVRTRQLSFIKGICFLNNGNVIFTEPRLFKKDLNHLPIIPARHLLPDPDFIMNNRLSNTDLRMTHVMTSQGCPFSCNFCASQQKRMQYRSGWHIRQELQHLKDTYGIEGFAVVGDNFLVNKKSVYDICESINDLNLKWSTLSRVDTIEYDVLREMYDAGCIEIKFGIESGSESILQLMSKGININQIHNAVKITHSIGIKVKAFIIHGYPGENMKTTVETITMLNDLSSMINGVSLFRFAPLPGSYIYKNAKDNGLHINDDWNKCHIHHNPYHWWGNNEDFTEVEESYKKLDKFILERWGNSTKNRS